MTMADLAVAAEVIEGHRCLIKPLPHPLVLFGEIKATKRGLNLDACAHNVTPYVRWGLRGIGQAQGKEKRKVGRPIMHKGDPDDPRLSEKERRRIKRRIANRESARRVRSRRQEELEEMQLKVGLSLH